MSLWVKWFLSVAIVSMILKKKHVIFSWVKEEVIFLNYNDTLLIQWVILISHTQFCPLSVSVSTCVVSILWMHMFTARNRLVAVGGSKATQWCTAAMCERTLNLEMKHFCQSCAFSTLFKETLKFSNLWSKHIPSCPDPVDPVALC